MKSVVFVLILWFSFSEALKQFSVNPDLSLNFNNTRTDCNGYCFSAMQTFLVNLVTSEHAKNIRGNVNITEKVMASTITDLQTLLQNKDRQIYLNNEQHIKYINMLRENIGLKNQEIIQLQNRLENLTEDIMVYMNASSRKDSQIQDNIEQLKSKDTQQNTQNYEKIKDLIEQINKTKEQEIISLQNRLKNLTEVITNYRIETARKDGKIQDNIVEINDLKEQLKDKLINQETLQDRLDNLTEVTTTQMNTKDTEIKDLRDQIKSTQSLSEKLNLTIDELATYKYTEQCPNFTTITFFQFKIRGINTFQARCAPSGWMVIQNRYDGSENFNRSWNEYKEDAQTYELYIFLKDSNGNTSYAQYSDFKIGSEEESYRLKSLGKYSGTAGPALDHLLQSKFSTFDRDISHIKGCAHSNGGGWWYKNCGTCALNGYYFRKPKSEGKLKFDIHWAGFRRFDSNITLTQTLMKIRPTTL